MIKHTRTLLLTGLLAALTACSTALPKDTNFLPQVTTMQASSSALRAALTFTVDDIDTSDKLRCTVDWGDGQKEAEFDCARGSTQSKAHTYAQNGDYAVLLTVSDGKGVATRTLGVKVFVAVEVNKPPYVDMLQVPVPDSILDPYPVRVRVNIAEQNAGDTLTCRVNWGDNTGFKPVVPCPKNSDFVLDYNYDRPGDYAVLLEVDDGTNKVNKTLGVTIRGYMVLTGSSDGTARIWNASDGQLFNKLVLPSKNKVLSAIFSPSGRNVLTSDDSGKVTLWDSYSGGLLYSQVYNSMPVQNTYVQYVPASFSPDGQNFAVAGDSGKVEIRKTTTGEVLKSWKTSSESINSIDYNSIGDRILTSSNKSLDEWNVNDGSLVKHYQVPNDSGIIALYGATYSPDGLSVAAGAFGDGLSFIEIWSASNESFALKQEIFRIAGDATFSAPKFSPNSKMVATAFNKFEGPYQAAIWDVNDGKLITKIGEHTNYVNDVAFNKQGTKLITGSVDTTAKIWDISSTNLLVTLQGHTKGITAVMFSPVRY